MTKLDIIVKALEDASHAIALQLEHHKDDQAEIERLRTDRAGLIQSWNKAESNRLADEALLRQALEVLDADNRWADRQAIIAALRERLGEKP